MFIFLGFSRPVCNFSMLYQGRNVPSGMNLNSILMPSSCLQSKLNENLLSLQPVRGKKVVKYKESTWKRVHKNSLHKRILTKGGIEVLWRRFLKGRHVLVPYDNFLFDNSKKTKHSLTQPKIYSENRLTKPKEFETKSFLQRKSEY